MPDAHESAASLPKESADLTPVSVQTDLASGDAQATRTWVNRDAHANQFAAPEITIPGYEVLAELGRGGMGVVYRARQINLKRLVALKMILAGPQAGPEALARFRAEAEAVARLGHPNIVGIYEVGEVAGRPFFSLEFLEGGTLAGKLQGTPQPGRYAAETVQTLARAMHAAHVRGIVHRDLKPVNVLLTADGIPKVADFGLAKDLGEDTGQTASGVIMGTPSYMAPEQALAQARAIGPTTDVYALGAILYEMLTGRPPFKGQTVLDTMEQVRTREPVPPSQLQPGLPRDLETICLKCLQKDPGRRYASADTLAEDLHRFLEHEPILARPVGRLERTVKWIKRRPVWAALIAVSLFGVLSLAGASAWLWQTVQARDEALGRELEASRQARENERRTNQFLHVADLRRASEFWKNGDVQTTRAILERYRDDGAEEAAKPGFEGRYFFRLGQSGDANTFTGHDGDVLGVAISPDRRFLATAGQDGTIRWWDTGTRQVQATWRGHSGPVTWLSFLDNGTTLASIGQDRTVRFWDPARGQEKTKPFQFPESLVPRGLSPDGRLVAVINQAKTAEVWDVSTGKSVARGRTCQEPIAVLAFAPLGQTLAFATGKTVILWEYLTGKDSAVLYRESEVMALAFSPRGWFLASGQRNGTVFFHRFNPLPCDPFYPKSYLGYPSKSPIQALAFSSDDSILAVGCADTVVRIWDIRHRAVRNVLKGHTDRIWSMDFALDGAALATASADGSAKVWRVREHQDRELLATPLEPAGPIAFAGQGDALAIACTDYTVALVDSTNCRRKALCRGHLAQVQALAFAADGKTLATASLDQSLTLWDATDGRPKASWTVPDLPTCVALAPDGRWLAAGMTTGKVRCWDIAAGTERPPLEGSAQVILGLAFAADSKTLAAGGEDRIVRFWEVATGKERLPRWELPSPIGCLTMSHSGCILAAFEPNRSHVSLYDTSTGKTRADIGVGRGTDVARGAFSLAFSPNDKTLAVPEGRVVQLIDVGTTARHFVLWTLEFPEVTAAAYHPGGEILATSSADGVRIWNLATWQVRRPQESPLGPVHALAFSPDGKHLITGCGRRPAEVTTYPFPGLGNHNNVRLAHRQDDLRLWDVNTGKEEGPLLPSQPGIGVQCLTVTPDGQTLLAGSLGGTIWRWDLTTRQPLPLLFVNEQAQGYWQLLETANALFPAKPEYTRTVVSLAALAEGQQFAAATDEGVVTIWDVKSGQVRATLPGKPGKPGCLAYDPKQGRLAISDLGQTRLWNTVSDQELPRLSPGHKDLILSLAISPHGRLLASGSQDRRIHLWDLENLDQGKQVLVGHTDDVTCLAFSPDERILASGSRDGTVRLWDMATAQELAVLEGHTDMVRCLAFSPDGNTLASGGDAGGGGEVLLWRAMAR